MAKSKLKLDLSLENILTCAVYAVIGLLLCILQGGSLGILMTVIGVLLIAMGIMDAVKNDDIVKGIAEMVVGVVVIVCGWLIADIVLLLFGIFLVLKGGFEIYKNYKKGFKALIPAIITVLIGILLIIAKWTLMDIMCVVAGVIFIINAVLTLFGRSFSKK